MLEGYRNAEKKDWKELLKEQVRNIWERIWKVLSQSNSKEKSWVWKKKNFSTERDAIKDILEWTSDFFWKKAIVVDIYTYSKKVWWEEKWMIKYKCKYWLWITISNLNSFITFCKIHWFIPMVDQVIIETDEDDPNKKKLSKKNLLWLFKHAIDEISHEDSMSITLNEIQNKTEYKEIQWILKEIVSSMFQIIHYNTKTYQSTYWKKLNKFTNIWSLSENIFVEVALRLENQIREKLSIESSYLDLAKYEEDTDEKTDMKFRIRKTAKQDYQKIPMQFTSSRKTWQESKEENIEKHLMKEFRSNNNKKIDHFILLTVNWEFSKHIIHKARWEQEKKESDNNFTIINEEYQDWINNPQEREKNIDSKFPLFIDSIDPKLIQPAEIMYIALHMLYKQHSFRYTKKKTYIDSFRGNTKINKTNPFTINGIKLSEISIKDCSIEPLTDPRLWYEVLLKHRFEIFYQWERMWVIVIYEADQKNPDNK